MRDTPAALVRDKLPHDLPARPNDSHDTIVTAEEQAAGPGAHRRNIVAAFEEGARVGGCTAVGVGRGDGGGEGDLRGVEEVEGLPLEEGKKAGLVKMEGSEVGVEETNRQRHGWGFIAGRWVCL